MMSEFQEVLRPIMQRQPGLFVLLVCYVFITVFGVFNLILSITVEDATKNARALEESEKESELDAKLHIVEELAPLWDSLDTNKDGYVTMDDVKRVSAEDKAHLES